VLQGWGTEANDLRSALSHLRWVGGGSGAAKSTVAQALVAMHNATLYDTDAAMRDHADRSTPDPCPRLTAFAAMSMDERWVHRPSQETLDSFHWFAGKGFELIVADLLDLPRDRPIVADGFRLLPRQVAPLLHDQRRAIWRLPTPAFRRMAFETRGTIEPSRTGRATRKRRSRTCWSGTRSSRKGWNGRRPRSGSLR
jgi:hypothetical protein